MASPFPARRWAERRWVVLAAAAGLFVAVSALRASSTNIAWAPESLYGIPVALVALELGMGWGLAAGVLALGLVVVWTIELNLALGALGVLTWALAFVAVGAVAGRFGDRMRDAQERQHQLLVESGLTLARLESLEEVPATLARLARGLCPGHGARVQLEQLPAQSADEVAADTVARVAIERHCVRYGTLVVSGSRRLSRDERATLEIVALQAAVAVENARLLESERERAALQAALRVAQADVAERRRQLREMLARQEVEHDHLAHQLHEEAAQTLAGVLLSLTALERELESAQAGPRLRELRTDIDSTLQSLRTLAVSLRPPSLALGLQAALVQLLEDHAGQALENVAIDLSQLAAADPEMETTVYRIVQEILTAAGLARSLAVSAHRDQLTIAIDGIRDEVAPGRLHLPKARIELAGGTLSAARDHLWARIPIPAS